MNMLLHHQKTRALGRGERVNVGEDGCPYAADGIMIAADGLGGRGGFPHKKLKPQLVYEQNFYDIAFGKGFERADEAFRTFVMQSFSELFQLGERYFTGTDFMRPSGYFASRLVTAIVLYELRFDPLFERQSVFGSIRAAAPDEREKVVGDILAHLSHSLEQTIQSKLSDMAQRMGLELESKTTGSYLLPTTLVATLTDETEEGVEALCFWAGDTRGYLWDAKEGLAQVTADHEKNETMTNLITLTKPFRIEGKYLRVPKPVILFNATDGCYKCPCFASPIDLEYLMLGAIEASQNFAEVSAFLDGQFAVIGTHDDSNTMALLTFGFADFGQVRAAALARKQAIEEQYVKALPEIFTRDYRAELEGLDDQMEGVAFAVKDRLADNEALCEYIREYIRNSDFAPYRNELDDLRRRRAQLDTREQELRAKLVEWVQKYWIRFPRLRQYCKQEERGFFDRFAKMYGNCAKLEENAVQHERAYAQAYADAVQQIGQAYEALTQGELAERLGQLAQASRPEATSAASALIGQLDGAIEKLETNMEVKSKAYQKTQAEIEELTRKALKTEARDAAVFAGELADGTRQPDALDLPSACRSELDGLLAGLAEVRDGRKYFDDEIGGLPDKHLQKVWAERAEKIIMQIYRSEKDRELLPPEVREQIASSLDKLEERRSELAECLEQRDRLYEQYAAGYARYLKESESE